jgi:hypothetical protein
VDPKIKLLQLYNKLLTKDYFTFIRFSDGEIEILRNRFSEIRDGKTVFRGRVFTNTFPKYDEKLFNPTIHHEIRKDLLSSAIYSDLNYIKGIQTSHLPNGLNDRNFLLRLNGRLDDSISFSDLLINSNYESFLNLFIPIFIEFESLIIVANEVSRPIGPISHAKMIHIPSFLFETYSDVLNTTFLELKKVPSGSLILSSASSLSNILGHKLYLVRRDIFFIDIGTSLNHLLSMSTDSRGYLNRKWNSKTYRFNRKEKSIKW